MTEAKYKTEVIFTKDTPYITLVGELWGVFCEDLGENWLRFNRTALYLIFEGRNNPHSLVKFALIKNWHDDSASVTRSFPLILNINYTADPSPYTCLLWNYDFPGPVPHLQLILSLYFPVGLCRTSEIFGAAEYVIACVKYLDDEKFSSLSVTSHKWLPIKEVGINHPGTYNKISNIRHTKSQHLTDSHTVLRLSLPNPLKPDVKSRMRM